jgi:hypothetical protein
MNTGFEGYDQHKCTEPAPQHPDPPDPHEACEREIARIEAEVEAAKHAPRALTMLELHALVGALLPDESYILDVTVHHSVSTYAQTTDTLHWRLSYGFGRPSNCTQVNASTAAELYAKLRAALPPNPLDEIGEIPF